MSGHRRELILKTQTDNKGGRDASADKVGGDTSGAGVDGSVSSGSGVNGTTGLGILPRVDGDCT